MNRVGSYLFHGVLQKGRLGKFLQKKFVVIKNYLLRDRVQNSAALFSWQKNEWIKKWLRWFWSKKFEFCRRKLKTKWKTLSVQLCVIAVMEDNFKKTEAKRINQENNFLLCLLEYQEKKNRRLRVNRLPRFLLSTKILSDGRAITWLAGPWKNGGA